MVRKRVKKIAQEEKKEAGLRLLLFFFSRLSCREVDIVSCLWHFWQSDASFFCHFIIYKSFGSGLVERKAKIGVQFGSVVYLRWAENAPPIKRVVIATGFHFHRKVYVAALYHISPDDEGAVIILAPISSLVHTTMNLTPTLCCDNVIDIRHNVMSKWDCVRSFVVRVAESPRMLRQASRTSQSRFTPSCPVWLGLR